MSSNGHIDNVDISTINASAMNSRSKQLSDGVENVISDLQSTAEGRKILASLNDGTTGSFTVSNSIGTNNSSNSDSSLETQGGNTKTKTHTEGTNTSASVGLTTPAGSFGTKVDFSDQNSKMQNNSLTGKSGTSMNFSYSTDEIGQLMKDKNKMAQLQDALETSSIKQFQDMASDVKAYNETQSFQASYGVNTETQIVSNYMKAHNLQGVEGMQQAMVAVEKMGADGNYGELSKYSGVGDYSGMSRDNSGLKGVNPNTNYFDQNKPAAKYKGDKQIVEDATKQGEYTLTGNSSIKTKDGGELGEDFDKESKKIENRNGHKLKEISENVNTTNKIIHR